MSLPGWYRDPNPQALISGGSTTPLPPNFGIIQAMNPAHIIYECLTNREWGRGLNASRLDAPAFTQAATALHAEGFGLCLKWTRKDSIESFVQSVLDHIGAVLFPDRTTGLLKLRLIRADYDFSSLAPFTTENGILEITEALIGSPTTAVNSVTVTYRDPITDEDRTVKVGNLASLQSSGGVINSASQDYPGVPVASLATRLAQRDLRAASTSLQRFTLVMDRRGHAIDPGSVIAIEDAKRGIPKTAVRVLRVEGSGITSGRVTITAVQDVFALPDQAFAADVPPTWTPPNTRPCIDQQAVFEVPYFLLARNLSPADLSFVDENSAYIGALSSQGQPMNMGFRLAVRDAAPTPDDAPVDASYNC